MASSKLAYEAVTSAKASDFLPLIHILGFDFVNVKLGVVGP